MLLVEYNVLENVQVITEGKGATQKKKLRGKFQKCDEQNNNGRIYPKKVLESQVKAIQEKINDRSLVGALDHPANDAIHLSQASHLITNLWLEDNGDVMGECEILSTPNGQIVQNLIDDGVKIGISSRGVGSVSESVKGKVVNEDFKLITFDLVSDPSTRGAFPELTESMRENSERAQEIVSKHKKSRVLVSLLESKIDEAMKKSKKKKKLDPVGQEDGDIDNDGDEDDTDGYLKNRRMAVRKAIMGKKNEMTGDGKGNVSLGAAKTTDEYLRRKATERKSRQVAGQAAVDRSRNIKTSQTASTEIFGQKIVEAYRNLVRKDEMNVPAAAAAAARRQGDPLKRHKMQVTQAVQNAKDQERVQAAGAQSRRAHKAAQAARRRPLAGEPDTRSPVYGSMADLLRKREGRRIDLGSADVAARIAQRKTDRDAADARRVSEPNAPTEAQKSAEREERARQLRIKQAQPNQPQRNEQP